MSRATAIALVGVPTIVPNPPSVAAKAMPIGRAPAMPSVLLSPTPPEASMASPIGIMISAVEVLEMNIEISAVAAITASSNCQFDLLASERIASASRRWSPVRSIARARKAPPRNRNITGE